jgi:hypothetical protein
VYAGPGPPLKVASINQSPEVKSILKQTHDLTTTLSNDPLGVAGILLGKELICEEIYSEMFMDSYTPAKKAAILVRAVRNTIEIAPVKFQDFLEILSAQVCAKEVVEKLRSAYQSSLAHGQLCQSILPVQSDPLPNDLLTTSVKNSQGAALLPSTVIHSQSHEGKPLYTCSDLF